MPAGDVKVLTLAALSLLDKNDDERQNTVRPAESHEVMARRYAEAHLSGRVGHVVLVSREAGTIARFAHQRAIKTQDAL